MTIPHTSDCLGGNVRQSVGQRGDTRLTCTGCGRFTFQQRRRPRLPVAIPGPIGIRRWLGCIDCGTDIWTTDRRPRVPLCPTCKDDRTRQANHDRRTTARTRQESHA